MSRNAPVKRLSSDGFPRVSGDEPRLTLIITRRNSFSPRERG